MRALVAALLPVVTAALAAGSGFKREPQEVLDTSTGLVVDRRTGLVKGEWNDPDIVADLHQWWRLPSQEDLFKPGSPRPYPPAVDYHSEGVRNESKVIVLIASHVETKVVTTLRTMFQRARSPSRVYAGVVQQNTEGFRDALEGLCSELGTPLQLRDEFRSRERLNRRQPDEDAWGHSRYTPSSLAGCEPASRVRMYRMDEAEAKGPAYARARQPLLLSEGADMEDFCMQIDAHTVFTNDWDEQIIQQWAATDNEYAVLSTYPANVHDITENGTAINSNGHWEMPHICHASATPRGLARNFQASSVAGLTRPTLGKLWAAGLSFSRCHAERDVPADPNSMHIFDGEEFGRGARLWTNGYDFYSPPRAVIGTWYGFEKGGASWTSNHVEAKAGQTRIATLLGHNSVTPSAEARSALKGYDLGTRRSLDEYIELTGLDTRTGALNMTPCAVMKWYPWHQGAQPPYQVLEGSPERTGKSAELRATAFDRGAAGQSTAAP